MPVDPRRLNLRQLEAFRAMMRTGTITAAAEMLFITQPAVSRLIADLQRASGLRLFERRGNSLEPTAQAFALMTEVERAFVGLEEIGRVVTEIAESSTGTLRIAGMPALANGILARFLARFVADRRGLRVKLDGVPSSVALERVTAGHAEIAYIDGARHRSRLVSRVCHINAVVALPAGHPLTRKSCITPADLAGQSIIGIEEGTIFAKRVDVALDGIDTTLLIKTQLSHTACSMVLEGAGVVIIDPYSACEFRARGLEVRPFSPEIDAGFTELRSAASARLPLVETFADEFLGFLRSEIASVPDRQG